MCLLFLFFFQFVDPQVRVWGIQSSYQLNNLKPPSAIRRRVMAMPNGECKRLLTAPQVEFSMQKAQDETSPSSPVMMEPIVRTPEGQKKRMLINFDLEEGFKKTPEATTASPSSVLSPPSSVKRTIRDYFIATSST